MVTMRHRSPAEGFAWSVKDPSATSDPPRVSYSRWDIDDDAPGPETILDEIPAITWAAYGDRTLHYVSPYSEELLGYGPEDWLDDPDFWVALLHHEDRERVVEELEDAVADLDAVGIDLQYRMVDADGENIEVYERVSIERDRRGRPVALRGVIAEVSALHAQLDAGRHLERHDRLTGLPNRHALREELDGAVDRGRFALVLLDLDRFHEVNQVLGHDLGDRVLAQVAERFAGAVGALDTLAHLGGDTFAVLAPAVVGREEAATLATRMRQALHEELTLGDDAPVYVEATAGIALCPVDGRDAGTLLRRADAALHSAKAQGRPHAFARTQAGDASPRRLRRLAELGRALDAGELVVHYQPKLDLQRGDVIGVEALVRWQHPREGLLAPEAFIPMAEQTHLITRITATVLAQALEQSALWRAEGIALDLSVNVSARDLLDDGFADLVGRLLSEHQIPARSLELEVTERAVLEDSEEAAAALRRLAAIGVRISLDDFGSGLSALGRLRDLPFDELKIDRTFIAGIQADDRDLQITRSAIDLGHSLDLSVVAEGLESPADWHRLAALGCDAAQGFALSQPLPADELEAWLYSRVRRSDAPPSGPRELDDRDESQAA
jgi:diguanylate cyclase (GGDEF)-like protein/PAS domain S-box-containing protein